jgi:flavin-dependent dehydrogenase
MHTYTQQIPDFPAYDGIVVGSDSAGSTAAIAADHAGAKVLLLEHLPFLG